MASSRSLVMRIFISIGALKVERGPSAKAVGCAGVDAAAGGAALSNWVFHSSNLRQLR